MSSENYYATTGNLKYFLTPPDGSRPYTNLNADSKTGDLVHNWLEDPHTVNIENVRVREEAAQYTAFSSEEEVKEKYYPESIELIKKVTGGSRAVIFDHTIRRRRPGEADDSPDKRQPVPLVHVDQTSKSSIARRFQIINLWRPISHVALDWPLALCDFRSVDLEKDLLSVSLIYPDREAGETYGVSYNPEHRWKYKRGMEPEDYVLIKCYDSDSSVATLTPHTGFQDPNTPEGAPLRESIEVRALVFFD
ncbi:hypothetical protein HYDPIDRAFT_119638 [Hydnomerulius pinastri MD-312]|uniref:7alpha-cephem-methoxylase P8 chain n=1 Tax=Hydnomerulius pinastri MD-312 TaxID=994086 RepID=A0A0C9W6G8_9AGAM|nr:hypothetical protein HYDPIDRAFT_119638 [Hydnomerulius pinastri MD-312]